MVSTRWQQCMCSFRRISWSMSELHDISCEVTQVHLGKSWRRQIILFFLQEYRQICKLGLWFSFSSSSLILSSTFSKQPVFITLNILIIFVQKEKACCCTRLAATFCNRYRVFGYSRKAQLIGFLASFVWPRFGAYLTVSGSKSVALWPNLVSYRINYIPNDVMNSGYVLGSPKNTYERDLTGWNYF